MADRRSARATVVPIPFPDDRAPPELDARAVEAARQRGAEPPAVLSSRRLATVLSPGAATMTLLHFIPTPRRMMGAQCRHAHEGSRRRLSRIRQPWRTILDWSVAIALASPVSGLQGRSGQAVPHFPRRRWSRHCTAQGPATFVRAGSTTASSRTDSPSGSATPNAGRSSCSSSASSRTMRTARRRLDVRQAHRRAPRRDGLGARRRHIHQRPASRRAAPRCFAERAPRAVGGHSSRPATTSSWATTGFTPATRAPGERCPAGPHRPRDPHVLAAQPTLVPLEAPSVRTAPLEVESSPIWRRRESNPRDIPAGLEVGGDWRVVRLLERTACPGRPHGASPQMPHHDFGDRRRPTSLGRAEHRHHSKLRVEGPPIDLARSRGTAVRSARSRARRSSRRARRRRR